MTLTSMSKDVLSLRQLLTKGLRESDKPLFRLTVLCVNSIEILIVDVNTIKIIRDDPLRHSLCELSSIYARCSRRLSFSKSRRNELDSSLVILALELLSLALRKSGPVCSLVCWFSGSKEEGEDTVTKEPSSFAENRKTIPRTRQ